MQKKRGQASLEYVIIVGFAMLMLIPIVILYGNERESMKDNFNAMQAGHIARKIVDAAEKVHFLGKPAQTTIRVNMPSSVENIVISEHEIYIYIRTSRSIIEISSPYGTAVNMTGSIPAGAGMQDIIIKAENNYVNITKR